MPPPSPSSQIFAVAQIFGSQLFGLGFSYSRDFSCVSTHHHTHMADTADLLPPVDSLANTLEAPPPAPLESARPHRPSTRSELFRLRREQGIAENEAARAGNDAPFWAKSLSGVEAASALGFATGGAGTTRRELMLARKLEAMADPEAGVPGVLVTSLARDYKDPGFDYVREPSVSRASGRS